ncbi:putative antiporter CaxA [Anneissia japonica]|uniref:putative antiporter CaxA n=1 Tax=Anneissia japonica TaxID=1529436 RepID=UPI00142579B1|nr:putative antiporter CaxA [Anneissia japonica]
MSSIVLMRRNIDKGHEKKVRYYILTDTSIYDTGRQILWLAEDENCTIPGILKFPHNLFTQAQRSNGAIVIHVFVSIYLCGAIAYVCEVYFVPSLELICTTLNIKSDVAGASFMAAGSSAPELFAAFIGTFVVEDDIGIETIVGSAAFNVFGIIGLCPFFCEKPIHLGWYPIMRDSVFWTVSILVLILAIMDSLVIWWEAAILSVLYACYILIMYFNSYINNYVSTLQKRNEISKESNSNRDQELEVDESTFIIDIVHQEKHGDTFDLFLSETEDEKGYTIHLSDNVMGFTFLAFGTSLPDLFGSIYVARDGYGDMAVANIIGSNIFEVLVCLGFLWFVRIATNSNWEPIEISSNSLILMSAGLFTTVIVIVVALWLKDWVLDRKLGLWSLATYVIFMTIVILYEQGLLGSIAEYPLPTCQVV